MSDNSLPKLLGTLHKKVHDGLLESRESISHSVAKGDASEATWLKMLKQYLPERYQVSKAFVVDSNGKFSNQMDAVVFDRQYTPIVFTHKKQLFVPAEGVYAAFEIRQDASSRNVAYAQEKIASVRSLFRTSMPIPHAGGEYLKKELKPIIGGLLTLGSEWKDGSLESHLKQSLQKFNRDDSEHLDIGCIASHGYFLYDENKGHIFKSGNTAATSFLFSFISLLQSRATVPMIDMSAYARWLDK